MIAAFLLRFWISSGPWFCYVDRFAAGLWVSWTQIVQATDAVDAGPPSLGGRSSVVGPFANLTSFLLTAKGFRKCETRLARMLGVIQDHRTLSPLGVLLFAGRSRNSLHPYEIVASARAIRHPGLWLWAPRAGVRIASRLELLLHHLFWQWRWRHGYRIRGSLLDRVLCRV